MESRDLAAMRREYARSGLSETEAGPDPVAVIRRWLDDAVEAGVPEPNAMALATAGADGRVSNRIVLLKAIETDGVVFYTSYASRKGHELAVNPWAAAVMLWHPLQRQVRIEGPVVAIPAAGSDAYFASRPRGSQVAAIASEQSAPVADREALERRIAEVSDVLGDDDPVRPSSWGGYRIGWETVELWHGRQDRLHDRLRYTRRDGAWTRERLQP